MSVRRSKEWWLNHTWYCRHTDHERFWSCCHTQSNCDHHTTSRIGPQWGSTTRLVLACHLLPTCIISITAGILLYSQSLIKLMSWHFIWILRAVLIETLNEISEKQAQNSQKKDASYWSSASLRSSPLLGIKMVYSRIVAACNGTISPRATRWMEGSSVILVGHSGTVMPLEKDPPRQTPNGQL